MVVWVCGEEFDRRRLGGERLGRLDRLRSIAARCACIRMTTDFFNGGGRWGAATGDGGAKPSLHME